MCQRVNIPLLEARKLAKNRAVARAIPLALGDNYRGYRIVGTTSEYAQTLPGGIG